MAAALAATRVDVCSCHAGSGGSPESRLSLSPVTGTDSSRAGDRGARSAELGDHLGGEELEMVEIGHVQRL